MYELIIHVVVGGSTITAVGLTIRFYLRYRLKRRANDQAARLISDTLLAHGPEGVEALTPVLAVICKTTDLPVMRAKTEPPVPAQQPPPTASTGPAP